MGKLNGYMLTLFFYKDGKPFVDYSTDDQGRELTASFSHFIDTELKYKNKGETSVSSFGVMNLSSLSYRKRLYKPNCLNVSLECSSKLNDRLPALAGFFKEARVKLEVVQFNETSDSSGNRSMSRDDSVEAKLIADKYEVYESSPRYDSSQGKMYLDLVVYSPDKALDTFEYSKAYTNKRLGLDIFKKEAVAIAPGLDVSCDDMRILRVQIDDETSEEFVQPYLVQYNESFHSFLSRVANRCGEFLFYEGGTLNLGVKKKDKSDFDESAFDKISFTEFNTTHNHETDSEDFYNNYMVKGGCCPSKSYVRNSELSGNEYFETVTKDGFSSFGSEWKRQCGGLFSTASTIFTNYVGSGLFLGLVVGQPRFLYNINNAVDSINSHFNKHFFSGSDDTSKLLFGSADMLVSAVGSEKINVNSSFYSLIHNKEAECGRKKLFLQISSDISKSVMLGDRIDFFKKEYVVIDVDASFGVVVGSNGSTSVRQPIKVIAVPAESAPFPPVAVSPVRKSGSQRAFVSDVGDPSGLGRVRVRYCWQIPNSDKSQNLDDSSPWIRVCSQMANSKGGVAYFKAAVGDSVIIDFENGNVDMPYVSGFLPTIDQKENKGQHLTGGKSVVISSEHGQMMLMSDPSKGNNMTLPTAVSILKNFCPLVGEYNDEIHPRFLGSTEFTDYYGTYSLKMSSTDMSISLNSPFGSVGINAFTGVSINAPNGDVCISGKNITLSAGNNVHIESGFNAKPSTFRGVSDMILGAASGFVAGTLVPMTFIDLSYLRNVIEIYIRPCEGTLSLKSYRYLMMQAGGADAKIPRTGFVVPNGSSDNAEGKKVAGLLNALSFIDGIVNTLVFDYMSLKLILEDSVTTWRELFYYTNAAGQEVTISGNDNVALSSLMAKVNENDDARLQMYAEDNFEFSDDYKRYVDNWKISKLSKNIRWAHNKLAGRINRFRVAEEVPHGPTKKQLVKDANRIVSKLRITRLSSGFKITEINHVWSVDKLEGADLTHRVNSIVARANLGVYENTIKGQLGAILGAPATNLQKINIKEVKRRMARAVIDMGQSQMHIFGMKPGGAAFDFNRDDLWNNYIKNVFDGMDIGRWGHFKQSLLNAYKTTLDKLNPGQQVMGKFSQDFRRWSEEQRGKIYISDTEGITMCFNNGALKSFSNSDAYAVKSFCEKRL